MIFSFRDTDKIRRPKSEARKKSEGRSPKALCRCSGKSHGRTQMDPDLLLDRKERTEHREAGRGIFFTMLLCVTLCYFVLSTVILCYLVFVSFSITTAWNDSVQPQMEPDKIRRPKSEGRNPNALCPPFADRPKMSPYLGPSEPIRG